MSKLQEYVDDINENVDKLDSRGPVSKYVLPDENLRGRSLSLSALFLLDFRHNLDEPLKTVLYWKYNHFFLCSVLCLSQGNFF